MTTVASGVKKSRKHLGWSNHPGVRKDNELTVGERLADKVRNGMGSWPFVIGFLVLMAIWSIVNSISLGNNGFDPYPYILLNLFLSMIAGLQGAILLIAAKRQDQISSEVASHTLANTKQTEQMLEESTKVTKQIHTITTQISELTNIIHDHIMGEDKDRADKAAKNKDR